MLSHTHPKHLPIEYSEVNDHLFFTSQMSFFLQLVLCIHFFLFHIIILGYITDSYVFLSKM